LRSVTAEPVDGIVDERVIHNLGRFHTTLYIPVVNPPLDIIGEGIHIDIAIRITDTGAGK
jgi:hypothetical protein